GLTTLSISGERAKEPDFERGDMPWPAFMYFNQPFQLTMIAYGDPGLTVRYAVGDAVPSATSPGLLYEGVPVELDDATGDVTVSARVFRGMTPCSGVTRFTFRNAKELSEILDCFDAIFVLRDPARWQVIEEANGNRYLQAGPYPEKAFDQAVLEVYVHYPENEVPDKIGFRWRLVSTLANPGFNDAGEWHFWMVGHLGWSGHGHQEDWQTSDTEITQGGWLSGTLSFDDYWASQPNISQLKLDRFIVGAPKATPKVTVEPPGAGIVSYATTEWRPFLGTERMSVNDRVQFRVEPAP
ncbi:MAG TPA: hypothetical protein PLH67_12910, partial [Lentisphaeria bacterium]|nr:hypothetical protein [Lentisphaeria bacterium]